MDLKHHWKNRINYIVLCIIVPIDSKYESGKYRRLGRQTFKKKIADRYSLVMLKLNINIDNNGWFHCIDKDKNSFPGVLRYPQEIN